MPTVLLPDTYKMYIKKPILDTKKYVFRCRELICASPGSISGRDMSVLGPLV
jgi:hypothetical protein